MFNRKPHDLESILTAAGIFSDIDIHFGRFIARFSANEDPDVFMAAALVSRATGNGDICLDLARAAQTVLHEKKDGAAAIVCPPLASWHQKLLSSPAVGNPGDKCPLILDAGNRLYLFRYWEYEKKLAEALDQRAKQETREIDFGKLTISLDRLFPPSKNGRVNWQKIAAVVAVLKNFSVVTGGPGSGKTFTIAGILALLLECTLKDQKKAKIFLAAPTGKAAARLAESIMTAKTLLDCSGAVKDAIPHEVYTIHRLLKPIRATPYFQFNPDNPLPADVVVVDEASMVDLALMSKLVQALGPRARLLLVGDKDQLASVEAGSVLGDICGRQMVQGFSTNFRNTIEKLTQTQLGYILPGPDDASDLQDCITILQESYRFSEQSSIGALSRAVIRGDSDTVLASLKGSAGASIAWYDTGTDIDLIGKLKKLIIDGYRKYLTTIDPVLAMNAFKQFKILCALKIGPFGADAVNRLAQEILRQEGLLPGIRHGNHQWYRGRPVLITQNDYDLGLFNGDIGLTLPDPDLADNELYVYFPDASGGFRRFPTHRLAGHETVYAMTVHKSQGSEFDHIVLLLPQRDYPLLTRELIYTGLTRARRMVSIWGSEPVLKAAVGRKIERTSGLRDSLWARSESKPVGL